MPICNRYGYADSHTAVWDVHFLSTVNKSNMEITSKSEWNNWDEIDWSKVDSCVFKLQKRIYRASQTEDYKLVHKLQKLMVKSWYGKLLAVRKVTQENKGKKTAGIDGIKSVSPSKRLALVSLLTIDGNANPTRRVWIPKPGKKEMRPLGIPTMLDRAKQTLLKLAIEPEWEAKFEPNSYGFRPGRSCHDAITAIRLTIKGKPKFVLDADIASCFDKINHDFLLNKINTFPHFKSQIKAWFKSGVIDFSKWAKRKGYNPTKAGVPQGGAISPLFANIALHGLELELKEYVKDIPKRFPGGARMSKERRAKALSVIRYADDFVIIHDEIDTILKCKEFTEEWLKNLDLELKPSKTRIAHTLNKLNGEKPGFNFLGFHIQQFTMGKHHSGKNSQSKLLGFKTIVEPQKEKIQLHYRKIDECINKMSSCKQSELIGKLIPIIRGWCNYQSPWNSSNAFKKLSNLLWNRLWRWGKRRHPNKSRKWIARKYWDLKDKGWRFTSKSKDFKYFLPKHADFSCGKIWVKVKESRSPFDGDETYWSTRMGDRYLTSDPQKSRLLKKQKGKCGKCGLNFHPEDLTEKHHIKEKSKGGNNSDSNLVLLHLHCHDKVHGKR